MPEFGLVYEFSVLNFVRKLNDRVRFTIEKTTAMPLQWRPRRNMKGWGKKLTHGIPTYAKDRVLLNSTCKIINYTIKINRDKHLINMHIQIFAK